MSPGEDDYPRAPGPDEPGQPPGSGPTHPPITPPRDEPPPPPPPPPPRPPSYGARPQRRPPRRYVRHGLEVLGVIFIALIVVAIVSIATHSSSARDPSTATARTQSSGESHNTAANQPKPAPLLDYHAQVVNTNQTYTNNPEPLFTQAIQLTNRNQTYVPALLRIQIMRDGYPLLIQSPILNGRPIHGGTSLLIPGAQQISLSITYQGGTDMGDHATLEISSNTGIPDKESPAVWFSEVEGTAYSYGQAHPS